MRDIVQEINALVGDGTYVIHPEGIKDYAARWSYGYIVGIRPLELADMRNFVTFGTWTDDNGYRHVDLVRHVAAKQDAIKLGQDFDQEAIYDLRAKEVVYL